MKKLLLFIFSVLVSIGTWAENFTFTGGSISIDGATATVTVTQPGAFSTWLNTTGNVGKLSAVTKVVFESPVTMNDENKKPSKINDDDINALSKVSTLNEIDASGCQLIDTNIEIKGLGVETLTLNKVTANADWGTNKGKYVIIQNCPNLQTLNMQNIEIVWPKGEGVLLTVTENDKLATIDLSGADLSVLQQSTNPNLDFSNNPSLSSLILARVDMTANSLANTTVSILDTKLNGIILPAGILRANLIYTDENNPGKNVQLHYIGTVTKDANDKYNIEVDLLNGGGHFKEFADAISASGEKNFDKISIKGELNEQDFTDMETTALPVPKIDLSGRELAPGVTNEHYRFGSSDNVTTNVNNVTTNVLLPEGWVIDQKDFENCSSIRSVMSAKKEDETTGATEPKYTVDAYVKVPGTLYETVAMAEASSYEKFNRVNVEGIKVAGSLLPNDIAVKLSDSDNVFDNEGHLAWMQKTDGGFSFNGTKSATDFPLAFTNANNIASIDLENAYFEKNSDMVLSKLIQVEPVKEVKLPVSGKQKEIPAYCFETMKNVTKLCIPCNYEVIGEKAFMDAGVSHIYTTVPKDYPNAKDARVDHGENTITFSPNLKEIKTTGDGNSTFFGGGINYVTDIYILAETAPKCGAYAFQGSLTNGNNGFNNVHPIQRSCYVNGKKQFGMLHFPKACRENKQAQNYTDITRKYTLYDETGANDAYGNTIMWPTHTELGQSYEQATKGVLWDDKTPYNKEDYQGWHEFVLADYFNVTDYDPQEYFDTFEEKDWYTLCVPYNLTKSQLLTTLGVRNIDGTPKTVKNMDGTTTTVSEDMYPDVRMLTHVSRSVGSGKVTFHLSENIVDRNEEVVIGEKGQGFYYKDFTFDSSDLDDPIIIRGGYPYLVRPYIPANDKITSIGKYVVAVMADMHETATARKDVTADKYTKGYSISGTNDANVYVPYEDYYVHAQNADVKDKVEYVYKDESKNEPCLYHFIGTYMLRDIPGYAYFLGKTTSGSHHFFWADYDDESSEKKEKWNEYSAIIIGLSTVDYGVPTSTGIDDAENYTMTITNGNDLVLLDSEKPVGGSEGTKTLSYVFDDSGETTAIKGVTIVDDNIAVSTGKVYNINGQYVGTSMSNLPKGVYVKDGKKFVVK